MEENNRHNEQFSRAVLRAVETMNHEPYASERLHKAADLVLTGRVTLDGDGTATVQSGSHTYAIDPEDGCSCEDARRRSRWCKHALAAEVLRSAQAQLHESRNGTEPTPPADAPPTDLPASAAWQVSEAQASCCLKFTLSGMEVLYTMRDVNDDLLFARVRRILPRILEKVNGNAAAPPPDVPMCPIHHVPMRRHTKGDQAWYSHKAPDGSWCRGS
jgi:hypothetical protein